MSSTIQYKVQVDTGNSVKSLGQLESELAAINEGLKLVAPNSDAFKELSKEAQNTSKQIENINKSIEGIKLEDKLETMDGALKVVAGSTQAVVGGLGLLGIESEKFKKFEESAASAIAFGMGLKDLSEGVGKLAKSQVVATAATKVATVAQKAFNAVMSMNPVGILIVALTTAAGLIIAFKDKILNFIKTALGPLSGIIDTIVGGFRALGEAVGLVDDAQTVATKNRIKQLEQQVRLEEAAGKSSLETQKKLAAEKKKLLEKGSEEYEAAVNEEAVLNIKIQKEKEDAEKAHQEKLKAEREKAAEKAKAAREKQIEEEKKRVEAYQSLLTKYSDTELDLLADTDQKKLDLEKTRGLAEIESLKLTQEEKTKLLEQFNEVYLLKQQELDKQIAEEDAIKKEELRVKEEDYQLQLQQLRAARTQGVVDDEQAEIAAVELKYQRILAEAIKNGEDLTTIEALKAEELGKINDSYRKSEEEKEKATQAIKEQAVTDTIDATQQALATLFGESKAIASANVLVDAGQAAVGILKSSQSIPAPFNIPFQISQFALLAATTFKSLQQINSAQPSGGGGGGAPSISRPNVPQTPTAQTPFAQNVLANQATQENQQPVRAYVVTGDVRSGQEADAKIRMRRTVGA